MCVKIAVPRAQDKKRALNTWTQGQCKLPDVLPDQRINCAQVGKPEIAWNSGGGGVPVGAEERARVEREREIACYLLQVPIPLSPATDVV